METHLIDGRYICPNGACLQQFGEYALNEFEEHECGVETVTYSRTEPLRAGLRRRAGSSAKVEPQTISLIEEKPQSPHNQNTSDRESPPSTKNLVNEIGTEILLGVQQFVAQQPPEVRQCSNDDTQTSL